MPVYHMETRLGRGAGTIKDLHPIRHITRMESSYILTIDRVFHLKLVTDSYLMWGTDR